MTHIEGRRLDHFLAVVETGSILGASQKVHLSQPALSRSIRELEETLGVALLERHPRGVHPTAYGAVLLEHARLLRNQERLARAEIEALRDGGTGHLRVGIAPSFYRVLPTAIARLADTHPSLTFEIIEGTYDALAAGVLAGDLEAAFTMFPAGENPGGLEHTPMLRTELVLAMRADHPLARKKALGMAELVETPVVIVSRPASLARRVREAFAQSGHPPPPRYVETDSVTVVLELLRSGVFVSALPREVVHREVREGSLVAKRIPAEADSPIAGIIVRKGAILPAALDVLRAAVETERRRMRLPACR